MLITTGTALSPTMCFISFVNWPMPAFGSPLFPTHRPFLSKIGLVYHRFAGMRCGVLIPVMTSAPTRTDFWGIADSLEYQHHIQTFFMIFFLTALRTSAFKTFWASLPYVNHKKW